MPHALLRLGMVYGDAPAVRLDGASNRMIFRAAIAGQVPVHGSGHQRRPVIHVDDAARALLRAADVADAGGATLNAVSANPTMLELAESVVRHVPGAELRYAEQDVATHLSFSASGARLRASGWESQVDHEAAVRHLASRLRAFRWGRRP